MVIQVAGITKKLGGLLQVLKVIIKTYQAMVSRGVVLLINLEVYMIVQLASRMDSISCV